MFKFLDSLNRTIVFGITVTSGTNPYILVDYNDSSSVSYQSLDALNTLYSFSHTFPNSGYFYVNVTGFNRVSSVSKIIQVSNFYSSMSLNYQTRNLKKSTLLLSSKLQSFFKLVFLTSMYF